jgi:hypothetical protein
LYCRRKFLESRLGKGALTLIGLLYLVSPSLSVLTTALFSDNLLARPQRKVVTKKKRIFAGCQYVSIRKRYTNVHKILHWGAIVIFVDTV